MNVSVPFVVIVAVVAFFCLRYMRLRIWHLIVCVVLGFLLAATSFAPEIQRLLNNLIHGGH